MNCNTLLDCSDVVSKVGEMCDKYQRQQSYFYAFDVTRINNTYNLCHILPTFYSKNQAKLMLVCLLVAASVLFLVFIVVTLRFNSTFFLNHRSKSFLVEFQLNPH